MHFFGVESLRDLIVERIHEEDECPQLRLLTSGNTWEGRRTQGCAEVFEPLAGVE